MQSKTDKKELIERIAKLEDQVNNRIPELEKQLERVIKDRNAADNVIDKLKQNLDAEHDRAERLLVQYNQAHGAVEDAAKHLRILFRFDELTANTPGMPQEQVLREKIQEEIKKMGVSIMNPTNNPMEGPTARIDVDVSETEMHAHKKPNPLKFTTDDTEGKIVWIVGRDFNAGWAPYSAIQTVFQEEGWKVEKKDFSDTKNRMDQEGKIVDDPKHSKLRLPNRVKIFVDGKEVEKE